MKVLSESHEPHALRLELEGMAGTESTLIVRRNDAKVDFKAEGAKLAADKLQVNFAPAPGEAGSGYVTQIVTIRW